MLVAERVYTANCASCHGQQMAAFVDRKWKYGKEPDSIRHSILVGYPDAGMPGWEAGLAAYQVDALVKYIQQGIENVEKYGFQEEKLASDTILTEDYVIVLDTVFSGIENPMDMTWLPNGDMLVTDRSGDFYRVDGTGTSNAISGVPPVVNANQDGLFDVLLHPDFEENGYLYLSYSVPGTGEGKKPTTTKVTRFLYSNDQLSDPLDIIEATPYSSKHVHFGARMVFDDAGYLYLTVGDRGARDVNPQDLSKYAGKIHRLNDDGSIPTDNPFVAIDTAIASIYSYGHRNPQGLIIHPETKTMWSHEHGPRGGDELNIIERGVNYGWPVISYGINYNGTTFTTDLEKEGMEQPVLYWVPSIAPSGMAFVMGDKYPNWEGDLMVGSLRYKYLNRCVMDGNEIVREEPLLKNVGRLRNVELGPDGYLYIGVEKPGYVFRLVPIGGSVGT
ncbi:MAG: PQQ-dependent sugar dehydrogenase [Bacteroidota bacterium]